MTEEVFENRLIGSLTCSPKKPTVIFFSGIHGNERAGVEASKKVYNQILENKIKVEGNVYFVYGNKKALSKNVRYQVVDLNRIWNNQQVLRVKENPNTEIPEETEQLEIYQLIKEILKRNRGIVYFIDLHTTSSPTQPFITISDSMNNRKFSLNFSVPVILGIEEFLSGPLLTYMNEFGYISLGFEAGEHYSKSSVDNCESFIWMTLYYSQCIKKKQLIFCDENCKSLGNPHKKPRFYQIDYRYQIKPDERFEMIPGFKNFESIKKDTALAKSGDQWIRAEQDGLIFMPLYQKLGDDGFFIINKISLFWLELSYFVRKIKAHHLLRILPGIQKHPQDPFILIVNPKVAKFMTKEIFHLFGYRQRVLSGKDFHFIKRDRKVTPFP